MQPRHTTIHRAIVAALATLPTAAWAEVCTQPSTHYTVSAGPGYTETCQLRAGSALAVTAGDGLRNSGSVVSVAANASAVFVQNAGTIQSTNGRAIVVASGGSLTSGISNTGLITAAGHAIEIGTTSRGNLGANGAGDALYNSGTITSTAANWGDESGLRIAFASVINGNITNTSTGVIAGHQRGINFDTSDTRLNGGILNSGLISGRQYGVANASVMSGGIGNLGSGRILSDSVGIFNRGTIGGSIALDAQAIVSGGRQGVLNTGGLVGGIDNAGTLRGTGTASVAFENNSTGRSGLFNNRGDVSGVAAGVLNTGQLGGILNAGMLQGATGVDNGGVLTNGIRNTGTLRATAAGGRAVWNRASISGGLENAGALAGGIAGLQNDGTLTGGLRNAGQISGDRAIVNAGTLSGGLDNRGDLTGSAIGLDNTGSLHGAFVNRGTISGATAIRNQGVMLGDLDNLGHLVGSAVAFDNVGVLTGNVQNTLRMEGGETALRNSGTLTGDITNDGLVRGGVNAIHNTADGLLDGALFNAGSILADGQAIHNEGRVSGRFDNSGTLQGGRQGVLNTGVLAGVFSNAGHVIGGDVGIDNAGTLRSLTNMGQISDTGHGSGVSNRGHVLSDVSNAGSISGTRVGLDNGGRIDGDVRNSGVLKADIAVANHGQILGALLNTGLLTGKAAAVENAGRLLGAMVNDATIQASGIAVHNTGEMHAFVNNGSISAADTGVRNAGTLNGDVYNSGTLHGGVTGWDNAGNITGRLINHGVMHGATALNNAGTISGGIHNFGLLDGVVWLGNAELLLDDGARITGRLGGDAASRVRVARDFRAEADAAIGTLAVDSARLGIASGLRWDTTQAFFDDAQVWVDGTLGGPLQFSNGSQLQGNGRVGPVTLGEASVAPGGRGTIGTLHVDGDMTFSAASRYFYDADSAGAGDLLDIQGVARLAGTATVAATEGGWSLRTRYTLLRATQGVTGSFDAVDSNFAFLTPTVTYAADAAYLTLTRNDLRMATLGNTYNQARVGSAIEATGLGDPVHDAVVQLDAPSALLAFDALSGELHATVRASLLREVASLDQLTPTRAADPLPAGQRVWLRTSGSQIQLDGNTNAAPARSRRQGIAFGAEQALGDHVAAGLAVARDQGSADIDLRASQSRQQGQHAIGTVRAQWDGFDVSAGAGFSSFTIEDSRRVRLPGMDEHLTARHRADARHASAELGYRLQLGDLTLRPAIAASHQRLRSDGFSERGGNGALQVDAGQDQLSTFSAMLGARWDLSAGLRDRAALDLAVGWEQRRGDLKTQSSQRIQGSAHFMVDGAPLAREVAMIQAGLSVSPSRNGRLRLGIAAQTERGSARMANLTYALSF
ncbi:MAG: autotransporter domain-containing protein [Pseudoxanthomonas sp.]